jgi:hypothetical protein
MFQPALRSIVLSKWIAGLELCPDALAMSEQETLSVSYRMTASELLRASRRVLPTYYFYYSLFRQIVGYVSLGALIVLLSCLANHLFFPDYRSSFLMSPFILIILIVYIDVWIIRRNLAQREACSPVFGPHRMSIAPDGLVDETSTSRHFYKWLGVEHIEIDSRFIYVIMILHFFT